MARDLSAGTHPEEAVEEAQRYYCCHTVVATQLLDLFVIQRRQSVQIRRRLRAKISVRDEGPRNILRDDRRVRP